MRFSRVLNVVASHAEGENGSVVVGGVGDVPGQTMWDKRQYLVDNHDNLRKMLLNEPRGRLTMASNIILPSNHPEADLGYVILETTEYPAMSGTNTICVATVLLETGMIPITEPVTEFNLESPGGIIRLRCDVKDGKVTRVRFTNQPSFVYHLGAHVEVPGLGTIQVDVAWGGMGYVLADAADLGFSLSPDEAGDISVVGQAIKEAANEQLEAVHPENSGYAGITQTELTGSLYRDESGVLTSRNAVVVSPGRLDRSPCGTGTSARLAVLHARGEIGVGENFIHRSIIDTAFDSRIEKVATVGGIAAVVASVAGQAWITELSQIGLDPTDPFPEGYMLPDTWNSSKHIKFPSAVR